MNNRYLKLVACPDLLTPRRTYHPHQEESMFDFERVALYLSDWRWLRQVDKTGCISLVNRNVSVGRAYYQQAVVTPEYIIQLEPVPE